MKTLQADVAIIGGGLVGCFTALFLRRLGRSVIVLEKGAGGAQSSGVNFGNVRLQGRNPAQYPLSLRSQSLWENLQELVGSDCEYKPTGHLYVALGPEQIGKMEQTASEATANGVAVEVLGGNEARRRWPWLGPVVRAASWSERDATANPRLVTPAAARTAQANGATIVENTRAVEIERRASHFRVVAENATVVEAEILINAAGAWGSDIAALFGEPVPLFPAGPPQFVTEPIPFFIGPSVQAADGTILFRQVDRGNVVAAGFPRGPADPVANRAPVPPAKTIANMNRLAEVVPALASAHVIRVWSGIEGYLPDMLPVIGASGTTPGLFHAFGFCGHGFQIGPAVGACLAELAVDGHTSTPLAPFAITRFRSGISVDDKFRKEFDAAIVCARRDQFVGR